METKAPSTEAPAAQPEEKVQQGEKSDELLLKFLEALQGLFPVEVQKESIRMTPHGLFVQDRLLGETVTKFQTWLQTQTGDATPRSERKCMKRLFGSDEPGQKYLVEGRNCLRGYLASCSIQQPQKYRLPYFLGSLVSTDEYLHPSDPALAQIKGLQVTTAAGGLDFVYSPGKERTAFDQTFLRAFIELLKHSSDANAEKELSMMAALKELLARLDKAKLARSDAGLLVPQAFPPEKKFRYLLSGSIVLVLDKSNRLTSCYELRARNQYHFVRNEFAEFRESLRGHRQGSFEVFDRRNEFLGCFWIWKEQYRLAVHAFLQFLRSLTRVPPQSERFAHLFRVKEPLEEFSTLLQTSQPIELGKVSSSLDGARYARMSLRVNEGWIFVINRDKEIVDCVPRFLKHPAGGSAGRQPHRGPDRRQRPGGRKERKS